ncbi:MAG: DUF5995 family protein [Streptosporangiaceae bacterium]
MTPPDGVPDLVRRWTAAGQRHDAAGGLLARGSASMAMAPRRRAMGRRGDGDGGAPAGSLALNALIERMEASLAPLHEHRDPCRFFHATYLHTTRAVAAELAAGGFFNAVWVGRWDVVFAGFYLEALEAGLRGEPVSGPWAAAFAAADDPGGALPPLRHVLLGMNAHVNFDLPQALLMVSSDAEFGDPALLARRAADHRHIGRVLGALVDSASGCRGLPSPAAAYGMRCSPGPTGWPPSDSSPRPGPRPACWPLRAGRARPPTVRGSRSWNGLPPHGSQILPRTVRCCCGSRPAASGSRCCPVPDPHGP